MPLLKWITKETIKLYTIDYELNENFAQVWITVWITVDNSS